MEKNIVTGNDELSSEIIAALETMKVKDIPDNFKVTLDQAKRLSRYRNILMKSKDHLEIDTYEKMRKMDFKIFVLNDLFKAEDWSGIAEIINSVPESVSKDTLKKMILALEEKRERIKEFQEEYKHQMTFLKRREEEAKKEEEQLKLLKKQMDEQVKFLKKYPLKTRRFLMKHIGFYDERLVLKRRVDSSWRKLLLKKKIVEYDSWDYVHYINDLDELANQHEYRTKRKLRTEWDYDLEYEKAEHKYYVSDDPYYKRGDGLADDLMSEMERIEEKFAQMEEEREKIQKEMKKLRKTNPESFMEAVVAANTLSAKDLQKHGELQDKAMKWLYKLGYVATVELVLDNGKRVDVVGYNEHGRIIVIEVKASAADFKGDNKWDTYLNYCDQFFFLYDGYYSEREFGEEKMKAGLLKVEGKSLKIHKEEELKKHEPKNRNKVIFDIGRALSKKMIFGY